MHHFLAPTWNLWSKNVLNRATCHIGNKLWSRHLTIGDWWLKLVDSSLSLLYHRKHPQSISSAFPSTLFINFSLHIKDPASNKKKNPYAYFSSFRQTRFFVWLTKYWPKYGAGVLTNEAQTPPFPGGFTPKI